MAEKILKGINFPGLEDTYMVPEVDSTLTVSGASADAKSTGDALNQKLAVATTEGTGEAYTVTIPNVGPITEGFTFIMIPHVNSTSGTILLSVNGIEAQLLRTDSQQNGLHSATIYAGRAYMVTKQASPSFWAITNSSKVLAEDVVGCGLKNALDYSFDYIDTLKDTGWYWTFLSDDSEDVTICGYNLQIGFPYMLHVENGNNKAVVKQTLTLPLYNGEVILTRSTDFDGVWHDWKEIVMTDKIPPNPNLLDNWYLADPVNQRGATTYTAEDYCIDRWYFEQWSNTNPSLVLNDGYITLSCTDANGDTNTNCIKQTIDNPGLYSGKTVTFSVKFKGVTEDGDPRIIIYSTGASGTKYAYKAITASAADSILSVTTTLQSGLTKLMVVIGNYANNGGDGNFTIEIESAKLELGSVSTLANDAPPKYSEQLLECQRYYIRFASDGGQWLMGASNGTTLYAPLHLPVPLRAFPVLEGENKGFKYANVNIYPYVSGGKVEITSLSLAGASGTQDFMLYATHASNALEAKQPGCIRFTTGGYIEISADL